VPNTRGSRRRFGAVRKLSSGRWQARYRATESGPLVALGTFGTKTEAAQALAEVETDLRRGTYRSPKVGRERVGDYGEKWLADHLPSVTPKTASSYRSLWTGLIEPTFGSARLKDLTPGQLRSWLANLSRSTQSRPHGLSPSRRRQALNLLSQMLDAAMHDGLITSNPCALVKRPRLPMTQPTIIDTGDMERIVEHTPDQYRALVLVLGYLGLRVGEAFALRRRSVNVLRRTVTVSESLGEVNGVKTLGEPKTHQRREIPVPASVMDDLTAHMDAHVADDPEAFLFVAPNGGMLGYASWRKRTWNPAVEAAGLYGVTPHALRASVATLIADRYGLLVAAQMLGHSSTNVTSRHYARAVVGRSDEVAGYLDDLRSAR
jgi:integrase